METKFKEDDIAIITKCLYGHCLAIGERVKIVRVGTSSSDGITSYDVMSLRSLTSKLSWAVTDEELGPDTVDLKELPVNKLTKIRQHLKAINQL